MKALQAVTGAGAVVMAFAMAQTASAEGWYGKVSVGETSNAAVEGINLNDGFAYGGALGTAVGPVRVEVGADHVSGDLGGFVDVDAWAYSATAYADFQVTENTGVFVGAGLDYISASANLGGFTIDGEGQGWHWTAGVAHRFSPGIIGEVSYRSVTADLDTDFGSLEAEYATVSAGLRFAL